MKKKYQAENSIMFICWNGNLLFWVISLWDNYPINIIALERGGVQEKGLVLQGSPPSSRVVHPHMQSSRDDHPPLLSTGEARTGALFLLWSPPYKRDMDILERVQWRAMNMVKGLEFLSYEVRLSLKKGKLGARGGSCWCVNTYFAGKDGGRPILMKGKWLWTQNGI